MHAMLELELNHYMFLLLEAAERGGRVALRAENQYMRK
jgi:hypothetical protein